MQKITDIRIDNNIKQQQHNIIIISPSHHTTITSSYHILISHFIGINNNIIFCCNIYDMQLNYKNLCNILFLSFVIVLIAAEVT